MDLKRKYLNRENWSRVAEAAPLHPILHWQKVHPRIDLPDPPLGQNSQLKPKTLKEHKVVSSSQIQSTKLITIGIHPI